jgi:hypothetical protein
MMAKKRDGTAATCGTRTPEERRTTFLWGNLKERLLGIPSCRWKGNIKIFVKDIIYEGVD